MGIWAKLKELLVIGTEKPPRYPKHAYAVTYTRPTDLVVEVLQYLVNECWVHASNPESKEAEFYAYNYDAERDEIVCKIEITDKHRLVHPSLNDYAEVWVVLRFKMGT